MDRSILFLENKNIYSNILKAPITVILLIFFGAYMSFIERRILALFQNRYGPNTVGWQGVLQLLADMIKIIFKEDFIPNFAKKKIFILSPIIAFSLFTICFAIVPISPDWIIIDLNIGILFFFMIVSLSVYSIILAGFSSNNKYSLIGSLRSITQIISYEVFLGISILGITSVSDSFNLIKIVQDQQYLWNIIPQFFGFIIFFLSCLAICHRHPFDQPESEQELSDGYHIEYSGIKFGMFFIGEYISMILTSSMIVTLFLGGWLGPYLPSFIWFIIKVFFILIIFILFRASLPRPRYDHIISLGWKICLPLSLINLLITAFFILIKN